MENQDGGASGATIEGGGGKGNSLHWSCLIKPQGFIFLYTHLNHICLNEVMLLDTVHHRNHGLTKPMVPSFKRWSG